MILRLCVVSALALSMSLSASALESRPMTVRDSIEKQVMLVDHHKGEVAVFSPDGRHFFVTTSRGVLPSGEIEAAILLFDSTAVSAALKSTQGEVDARPRKIASISAVSDTPPITDARWAADSETVAFLGRGQNAEQHLFIVRIENGQLSQLSPDGLNVGQFDRVRDRFLFTATSPATEAARYWQSAGPQLPDVHVGTGQSLFSLLYPKSSLDVIDGVARECILQRVGCTTSTTGIWQVRNGSPTPVRAPGASTPIRLSQTSGATVLLAPDGGQAILTNVSLPDYPRPWVVAVDTATGQVSRIEEIEAGDEEVSVALSGIAWREPGPRLALRYKRYHNVNGAWIDDEKLYQLRNGAWTRVASSDEEVTARKRAPRRELSIAVRESVNEAPVLTASVGARGRPKVVWDPNPQFARIDFGEATVYRWRDREGHEWTGGLVKPPDYVAGRRYPLVIQTHGFAPHEFLTDGIFPTANAARPMAGRGIVVLQVGEIAAPKTVIDGIRMGRPEEASTMRAGYVAAIEELAAEGLIDPHKVGIIGFSWTGWYAWDSLLHAQEHFVAATLAETTNMSFGEYTMSADRPAGGKHIEMGIGTRPFGVGLQRWLERSPGFNADKIRTPVLLEANSPEALIYGWDMYALLRLQGKPVELLYIRNGQHVLGRPLQRLASQEMNVDWFDFWLNSHEDPDPAKEAQYRRWRAMTQREGARPR